MPLGADGAAYLAAGSVIEQEIEQENEASENTQPDAR
jgi:hypothetical protein